MSRRLFLPSTSFSLIQQRQQQHRQCFSFRTTATTTTTTTATTRPHLSALYYHNQKKFQKRSIVTTLKTATSDTTETLTIDGNNDKNDNKPRIKMSAKEKRQKLKGLAKAVDRGQYAVTYSPGGTISGQVSFTANSGLPDRTKLFTVLGIESSCDDTGAAIVRSDGIILGEALASQNTIHEEWGGVVPSLARDAHIAQINTVIQQAMDNAGLTSIGTDIDAIGVTVGPGLEICLRVGTKKAIELAQQYNKPFIGVHHLEAHILMARMPYSNNNNSTKLIGTTNDDNKKIDGLYHVPATDETHESYRTLQFPFLALLVSGGHCQLLKCIGIGQYEILGGTIDDSLGEAFDKTARLLGLPVGGGGGPAIERLAQYGDPKSIQLSIPMLTRKDCDFSFAGLKTNVRRAAEQLCLERQIQSPEQLSDIDKANLAASFQNIAIKHIEHRVQRVMDILEQEQVDDDGGRSIRTLAVVGGVAANTELRTRLETLCQNRAKPWTMKVPPPRLCTDQGAMSAWAAIERLMVGSSDDRNNQEVYARYPFAVLEDPKQ